MGGGYLLSSSYKTRVSMCTRTNETVWHDGKSCHMPEYPRLQNEVTILALDVIVYVKYKLIVPRI